ncbi:MAG: glycosyltransferase family 4 protein [Candidatus Dormibacteria bacterium]
MTYRGNPHSGGQGVYVKHLARSLRELGHSVEVFSGQPYPEVDCPLTRVPSLDLYRAPDPFRLPRPREFRDWVDVLEYGIMVTAGFPEPLTYSLRVRRQLAPRRGEFDIIHDNQCLGYGILQLARGGWPVVATIHHPIHVDRQLELLHTRSLKRRLSQRRWFGFLRMQGRVARSLPRVITVSENSAKDLAVHMGLQPDRLAVVPVGVDQELFRPLPEVARVPGRILAMASADVALKGMDPLLQAVARLRRTRDVEVVVVNRPRADSEIPATIRALGLEGAVRFVHGISDDEVVRLYAEAEVAVVPSLYEGFSLPAIQAMACGVPLVATTAGALPEVIGPDRVAGLLVPPGDPTALAAGLDAVLGNTALASRLGAAGRSRALQRFTWRACAEATAAQYREVIGATPAARAA